jgi:hypothetical protein
VLIDRILLLPEKELPPNAMNIFNDSPCDMELKSVSSPSVRQTLERRKIELESRLAEVNAAIAGLSRNPEVAEVIELIAKVRGC